MVRGRPGWQLATVAEVRDETATCRTLVLDVPGWPGHLAGQHVDVRLTAPDGYRASRSYSIASGPGAPAVELTVELVEDGEVSSYLTQVINPGDPLELRGPVGGWFVWRPGQPGPVQLIGGGSGIVPLMAMMRAGAPDVRLLYSVRRPDTVIYADELEALVDNVTLAYTREAPEGVDRVGRIDAQLLEATTWPPGAGATTYVCGPTPFVETTANLLVDAGHDPATIRTERFGGLS